MHKIVKSFIIFTIVLFGLLVPQKIFVGNASSIFAASSNFFPPEKLDKLALLNNEMVTVDLNPELIINEKFIKSGLLYDATENTIVWKKDMNGQFPIASLTKMMTCLLILEDIKQGKIKLTDQIKMTKEAYRIYGSRVYMPVGRTYSLEDLLNAAMIASANNACYLLAQYTEGSEAAFVERMNKRVKELGMENTGFTNCTGMPVENAPEKDNFSSASDLLILAKELLKFNESVEIASKDGVVIKNGYKRYFYRNHNRFVTEYKDEVDGLKTGWTVNAGHCLVATAKRCDHRIISIALGASNGTKRYLFVSELFNNYYCNIGLGKLGENTDEEFLLQSDTTQQN